jgi:hypothetical protein
MSAAPGRIATAELTSVIDRDRPLTVEFSEYVSATALVMEELGVTPSGAPPWLGTPAARAAGVPRSGGPDAKS